MRRKDMGKVWAGWLDLGSDVSWDEYGGKWGFKAPDGSWYVLDFTNMDDACGRDNEGKDPYVCEVKRVNLPELSEERRNKALSISGFKLVDGKIETGSDTIEGDAVEQYIVEACVSYGMCEPIGTHSGKRAVNVRAQARKLAESLVKDAFALETARQKPVNKIGSTAADFGRGNVLAGLHRGPFDEGKSLVRKMYGLAPPATLRIGSCPFLIIAQEHYRDDGSCLCNNAAHREMMIREWEYRPEQFASIPLVD